MVFIYTYLTALTIHAYTSLPLPERLLLVLTSSSTIGVGIHPSLCEICISELCDLIVSLSGRLAGLEWAGTLGG